MKSQLQAYLCRLCCKEIDVISFKTGRLAKYHEHCKKQIILAKLREKYIGIIHIGCKS